MLPQQPCSRSGARHAVDLPVTRMLCVLVTLMETISNGRCFLEQARCLGVPMPSFSQCRAG
jgi:hypothetical protein